MKTRILLTFIITAFLGISQVSAQNCNASFTWGINDCDSTVDFKNGSTQDSGYIGPVYYEWTFFNGTYSDTSTAENPIMGFPVNQGYNACLIMYDTAGCRDTFCDSLFFNPYCDTCNLRATFTDTTIGGITYFTVTPSYMSMQNAIYVNWNYGDSHTEFKQGKLTAAHTYANGVYNVCAWVYDSIANCSYTFCDTLDLDTCTLTGSISMSKSGDTMTFGLSMSNGSGNYVTTWHFGDLTSTISYINSTVTHIYNTSQIFNLSATVEDTTTGCIITLHKTFGFTHSSGMNICGMVRDSGLPSDSAMVYLIEHDTSAGTLTALDSVLTDSGEYCFYGYPAGKYLVKAALLPGAAHYANTIPTYFAHNTQWSGANAVYLLSFNKIANINMVNGTNPGGPGFIGGLISAGANKTNNLDKLLITVLLKDAGDNVIAYSALDGTYRYAFDNLPYGVYKVLVDIPGRSTVEYTVMLDENNTEKTDIDFEVNSTNIKLSVNEIPFVIGHNIYPNPASDVLNVDLDINGQQNITLELVDMQGRVVVAKTYNNVNGTNTLKLDIAGVNSGVYMLKINVNSYSIINKVIVNK